MIVFSPLRWWRGSCLLLFFVKEVVLANLQVAWLVLFVPNDEIQPGILKLPLQAKSDLEIFLLSTMITLTPGTLSLAICPERKFLYFHVLHSTNNEATIASIQTGFESKLLEVLR